MRVLLLTTGTGLSICCVLLAITIFQSGEAEILFRVTRQVHGYAAYAMAVAYLAVAPALVSAFALGANVGSKYWLQTTRDFSFFLFAAAFLAAVALGVLQVYGNVVL